MRGYTFHGHVILMVTNEVRHQLHSGLNFSRRLDFPIVIISVSPLSLFRRTGPGVIFISFLMKFL